MRDKLLRLSCKTGPAFVLLLVMAVPAVAEPPAVDRVSCLAEPPATAAPKGTASAAGR